MTLSPQNADREQVVLESDPYRRLAYTWHTFTPEWAEAFEFPDDQRAAFASEPRSRVTFELEPDGELVKLTVIHGGFEPGSVLLAGIGDGWPRLLSALKTLVETDALVTFGMTMKARPHARVLAARSASGLA
jgi:uncharacterized protein YndB with AHSA1/START domain